MAPSQIDAMLNHMQAGAGGQQIMQSLQYIADHDSTGKPLPKPVVTFIPKGKPTFADADPTDSSTNGRNPSSDSKDMGTLLSMLKDATGGPAAAEATGTAPAPTQIAVIPPDAHADVITNYNHLLDMASMIQLYTTIYDLNMQKARGAKYPNTITDAASAAQAFADQANAAYTAFTGPLAGFLDITSEVSVNYSKNMRRSEIHLEFLGELFKGFDLGKDSLDILDGVLTNFVSTLTNVSVTSSNEENSIDHTLIIHQVPRINVTGDDENPVLVYEPKLRLVYMKIDSKTWAWATNKASDSGFSFNMHNVVVDATLNIEKYLGSKDKLDKIFVYLTDENLQEFGAKLTGKPLIMQGSSSGT